MEQTHSNSNAVKTEAASPLLRFALPAALVLLVGFQFLIGQGIRQELSGAQAKSVEIWHNSGTRFPLDTLSAPFYVPVLVSPLVIFDAGESAWIGQSLWLQLGRLARSQDQMGYDYIPSGRFMSLTAAALLQFLIPALAIWVTWRMKQSGRLERSFDTWMATVLHVFEQVAPGLALACLAVGLMGVQQLGLDGAMRLMLLLGIYMLYAAAATSFCLAIFLWVDQQTLALTLLAFFWCFNVSLARPIATNVANSLYPLPTLEQFARKLELEARNGYNGVEPKQDRDRRFVQETLLEYKVKEISDLPVNLSAILLQKEERHQREIFLRRIGELREQMQRQENVQGALSLLFPHVGIQIASAALSGTSARAERAQQIQSDEQWGRILERVYKDVISSSGPEGKMLPRGPEYWQQIPFVKIEPAAAIWSIGECLLPILGMLVALALCGWQVLMPPALPGDVEEGA